MTPARQQEYDGAAAWAPGDHTVRWVLPTTHPSAVLRSRNRAADFDALVADLVTAREARSESA